MQYLINRIPRTPVSIAWWDNEFSKEQLDYLQEYCKSADQPGRVGFNAGSGKHTFDLKTDVRRCNVKWLESSLENNWLFSKLGKVVSSLNAQFFGFNIDSFSEPIQMTTYNSSDLGTYGWHTDVSSAIIRKFTCIMQLSEPDEYTGGELQVNSDGIVNIVPKKRGHIVVFPSYVIHQVTPVTSGSRQSLVSWVSGPGFV